MLRAVLMGVIVGLTARLLMRVVVLLTGSESEFTLGATVAIVALFVVASVGSWLGARLVDGWPLVSLLVILLAVAPLWLAGGSIAVVEVGSRVGGSLLETLVVGVAALAILSFMVAAPRQGWRAGRRRSSGRGVTPGAARPQPVRRGQM